MMLNYKLASSLIIGVAWLRLIGVGVKFPQPSLSSSFSVMQKEKKKVPCTGHHYISILIFYWPCERDRFLKALTEINRHFALFKKAAVLYCKIVINTKVVLCQNAFHQAVLLL